MLTHVITVAAIGAAAVIGRADAAYYLPGISPQTYQQHDPVRKIICAASHNLAAILKSSLETDHVCCSVLLVGASIFLER